MGDTGFSGWPPDALAFFAELAADNTKAFWQANKHRYDASVRAPFEALSAEVEREPGPLRIFRPYRDVRFSKDKTPYKTAQGAVTESEQGAMYYLQISADGLMVGQGYPHFAKDQLARFRAAVDSPASGPGLVAARAAVEKRAYRLGGDALTSAPRGFPKDHARIELLRFKGLYVYRELGAPAWLHTKAARGHIVKCWHGARPVVDWLDTHVGPSEEAPPGFDT